MSGFLSQQFPARNSAWFDPKTGEINPVQYNLMRSMWLRTGGGVADATANGLQSQITAQSVRIDSEAANTALNTNSIAALVTNLTANYAPLASPHFLGVPTVPTAVPGVATGQVASTGFATAAVSIETTRAIAAEALALPITTAATTYAPLASPTFTGTPVVPGYATIASVTATYAPLASPTFTGAPVVPGYLSITVAAATYAPKTSPTFTGTLTTPAAALGTATGATLALTGGAGFFAHTVPSAQPAAPATLADVILAGRAYGLWA